MNEVDAAKTIAVNLQRALDAENFVRRVLKSGTDEDTIQTVTTKIVKSMRPYWKS